MAQNEVPDLLVYKCHSWCQERKIIGKLTLKRYKYNLILNFIKVKSLDIRTLELQTMKF